MRFLHANIRSFRNNLDKLNRLLEIFEPEIFGLNETHFEDHMDFETYKTPTIFYDNSKHIFRIKGDNRSPPISGTSIFNTDSVKLTSSHISSDHEIINCKISTEGKKLNLIYAYLSPSSSKPQIINFYDQVIKLINDTKKSERLLLIGDLNAKNNSIFPTISPNFSGDILAKILNGESDIRIRDCKRQLINLVKFSTRKQGNTENLLDFVITDTLTSGDITVTHTDPVSDHDTLIIDIGMNKDHKLVKPSSIISYAYEEADKDNLRKAIFELTDEIRADLKPNSKSMDAISSKPNPSQNYPSRRSIEINNLNLTTQKLEKKLLKINIILNLRTIYHTKFMK